MSQKTHLPIQEHLSELRSRLVYCILIFILLFIVAYVFSQDIYNFLVQPLAQSFDDSSNRRLIYTGLTEAFFTYVKLSFYTALFLSFPFLATQLYIFMAPGLYKKERKVLLPFLIACPVLFLIGAALVYYFIFPLAWTFFLGFESLDHSTALDIQLETRVSEYLSLVIQLVFAFGIAFQLPILLTLLARVGFLTSDTLKKNRKYALVIIVTLAAMLTPPDIISQIGLALPMLLLYECSVFSCRWIEKR